MGKRRNRNKNNVNAPSASSNNTINNCSEDVGPIQAIYIEDRCKYERLPEIIPINIFDNLANAVFQLHPLHRNVVLTMKEYNEKFFTIPDSFDKKNLTDIIVICIRIIATNEYQPIGALQSNRNDQNQAVKFAIVWKAYLEDLSILRLVVVASISNATRTFFDTLEILCKDADLETRSDVIKYSVGPFNDIVHLFEDMSILKSFDDEFYETGVLSFLASEQEKFPYIQNFALFYSNVKTSNYVMEYSQKVARSSLERAKLTKPLEGKIDSESYIFGNFYGSYVYNHFGDDDLSVEHLYLFYMLSFNLRFILATARFNYYEDYLDAEENFKPATDGLKGEEFFYAGLDPYDEVLKKICYNEKEEKCLIVHQQNNSNSSVNGNNWKKTDNSEEEEEEEKELIFLSYNEMRDLSGENLEIYLKKLDSFLNSSFLQWKKPFSSREFFNLTFRQLPIDGVVPRICNYWLGNLKAYMELNEKFKKRGLKSFKANLFTLKHIDAFILPITNSHVDRQKVQTSGYNLLHQSVEPFQVFTDGMYAFIQK